MILESGVEELTEVEVEVERSPESGVGDGGRERAARGWLDGEYQY